MIEYSVDEFLTLRRQGAVPLLSASVYFLKNIHNNKVYIGQSEKPLDRVFTHFTGRGNGDVYADYKYGADFLVRFYVFDPNQFRDINELEYHLIRIYESDKTGYNRQAGNRTRQFS